MIQQSDDNPIAAALSQYLQMLQSQYGRGPLSQLGEGISGGVENFMNTYGAARERSQREALQSMQQQLMQNQLATSSPEYIASKERRGAAGERRKEQREVAQGKSEMRTKAAYGAREQQREHKYKMEEAGAKGDTKPSKIEPEQVALGKLSDAQVISYYGWTRKRDNLMAAMKVSMMPAEIRQLRSELEAVEAEIENLIKSKPAKEVPIPVPAPTGGGRFDALDIPDELFSTPGRQPVIDPATLYGLGSAGTQRYR